MGVQLSPLLTKVECTDEYLLKCVSRIAVPKLPGFTLNDLSINAFFVLSVYAPGPTSYIFNYFEDGDNKPRSCVKFGNLAAEVFVYRVELASSSGPKPL